MLNVLALLLAFAMAVLAGGPFIRFLKAWKLGQIVREEGPSSHQAKAGTPSMGGWLILAPALLAPLCLGRLGPETGLLAMVVLGHSALGWLDDYLIVKKRHNKGLSPRQKLLGQLGLGAAFALGLAALGHGTGVVLPITHTLFDLGWAYHALVIFLMVGVSNAVNLTDGLDGLAAGTSAIATLGLLWAISALGQSAPGGLEACLFALIGGCLGFLWFNAHPAQVFMGDTGSLGLGAFIAGAAILARMEFWLIPLGIVFIAETLSVMAQVAYFKRTGGKRLFKMSPLHHHFELSGWKETKVVARFYLIGALGAVAAAIM